MAEKRTGPLGFFEVEKLSDATKKGMGLHRATAYTGTPENPTGLLGFRDFRTGSGWKRTLKYMRKLVGLE